MKYLFILAVMCASCAHPGPLRQCPGTPVLVSYSVPESLIPHIQYAIEEWNRGAGMELLFDAGEIDAGDAGGTIHISTQPASSFRAANVAGLTRWSSVMGHCLGRTTIWLRDDTEFNRPRFHRTVILHELGHALGLPHIPDTVMNRTLLHVEVDETLAEEIRRRY